MQHDPLPLIRALFSRVLLCDAEGRVVEAIGTEHHGNVFADPVLATLRGQVERALAGIPFDTAVPMPPNGMVRVRAVPVDQEGPVRLIVAFEPETLSADRLRYGGSEASELAFLIRHMRQGLWRLDADDRIVEVNEYAAAWLESTTTEMVGTLATRWRRSEEIGPRYETEFVSASGLRKRGLVTRSEVLAPTGVRRGAIEIITDVTAEHALKAKLVEEVRRMSHLARTDALTGLPNRLVFEERLGELQKTTRPYAVVLVDLDDLKVINDDKGHASGDQALVEIGNRLRDTLRTSDLVARIGGDEFAALLPDTDQEAAAAILVRLRERLDLQAGGGPIRASVGLAHSRDGAEDVTKSADEAMYRHKRSRKNGG